MLKAYIGIYRLAIQGGKSLDIDIFSEKNFKKIIGLLVFILCLSFLDLPAFEGAKEIIKSIVTTEPAKDIVLVDNNVVSVFFGYEYLIKEARPDIKIPCSDYNYVEGVFYIDSADIDYLVTSCADGIIKSIGYDGDKKYIEILHSGNIKSVYYDVDVIGVNTNLKVKKGDVLCTTSGDKIKFYFKYNDEVLTEYNIIDGEIVWQN